MKKTIYKQILELMYREIKDGGSGGRSPLVKQGGLGGRQIILQIILYFFNKIIL